MSASLPLSRRKAGRLWIILACMMCLGGAVGLVLNALSGTIVFFMAPSQLLAHPPATGQTIRLGGMVVAGSLHTGHDADNTPEARFDVTDGQAAITVQYQGLLPDLFREGQSVVALGQYSHAGGKAGFAASEVLAKHDETYMPREVADALRKSGKWDPRFGPPPDAASWSRMITPAPGRAGKPARPQGDTTLPPPAMPGTTAVPPARNDTRAATPRPAMQPDGGDGLSGPPPRTGQPSGIRNGADPASTTAPTTTRGAG